MRRAIRVMSWNVHSCVGTDRRRIFSSVSEVLADQSAYDRMSRAHNPYGDGHAAARIAAILRDSPGLAP